MNDNKMQQPHQCGFTLVEVMVALVVASLGLAAISVALQQHIDTVGKLRDRTLALYIGSNTIATLRLSGAFPDVGRSTDEVTFADRDWLVVTTVQESGIDGLRRTDVSISPEDDPDRVIRVVAGFVSNGPILPAGVTPSYQALTAPDGQGNIPGGQGTPNAPRDPDGGVRTPRGERE